MKSLNIVVAVDRTYFQNLIGMQHVGKANVTLPDDIVWTPLQIKSPCSLSITDKDEDKNTIYTAKLVFKTCEDIADRHHYAYRCRLIDGRCRLLGTAERPFAVMTIAETMPENLTDSQLNEVTVTYSSARPIPTIIL